MNASQVLTGFNNHFFEFLEDIIRIFPDNIDVQTCKNSLGMIRKANPRLIVKIWKSYVIDKYGDKIEEGDLDFFVNKDYGEDIAETGNAKTITDAIDRIRKPIQLMTAEEKSKTLQYLKNLKKLCCLYSEII
jgi:hypothetical protein